MTHLIHTLIALIVCTGTSWASTVKLKLTYRNNPLCYWTVTIKHGDAQLATSKSDSDGMVEFRGVKLLSNRIDANGIKTTPNGEKKWDVKGYIVLDDNGYAHFDFERIVKDAGMSPSMLEAAWGLTLNDCSSDNTSDKSSGGGSVKKSEGMSEWDAEQERKSQQRAAERKQFEEDWQSGKTQAETFQKYKKSQEQSIVDMNAKLDRQRKKLATMNPDTKAYTDLDFDIHYLELDRDEMQVKLDKTNMGIANGNTTLNKYQREEIRERFDEIDAKRDALKKLERAGLKPNGNESPKPSSGSNGTNTPVEPNIEKTTEGSKKEKEPEKEPDSKELDAELKLQTPEELSKLSVLDLKKLKMDSNGKIARRKTTLATKRMMMAPDRITKIETDIESLKSFIQLIDNELTKRKEAK